MAASDRKDGREKAQRFKARRLQPSVTGSVSVNDSEPIDKRPRTHPEEIEALDEKSLDQVVRECPL